MQRGVLGRIDGTLGRIDSFSRTRRVDGRELTDVVEVAGVKRTAGGLDITRGRAATQDVAETETVSLEGGTISVGSDATVETSHTEFLAAGDEFAAVASGDGAFAFDLLGERFGATIERAAVDLDALWVSLGDATPWKVGFYGHDGPVENGVVHGEHVLEDGVFGSALADLRKNQLGVAVEFDGEEYRFVVTRSGYLELYHPREFAASDFAGFVVETVLPHVE